MLLLPWAGLEGGHATPQHTNTPGQSHSLLGRAGGMGAGIVPLSKIYAEAIHGNADDAEKENCKEN